MHFLLGTIKKDVPGPELEVDCLWCDTHTTAHSRKRIEWLMLFHIVPVFPFHTVFVSCDTCHKDMIAKCSLQELAASNPLTLKLLLVKRVSFVARACIVLGLLLCWTPWCGLTPAIVGCVYGRKYGGWMKRWGYIGLVLNICSPLIFLGIVVLLELFRKL